MSIETLPAARTRIEITLTTDCIHVAGDLDAASSGVLREAIVAVDLVMEGPIVVDMSKVEFMDTAAVNVLLGSFSSRSDGVTIVKPSPAVEAILQLTGLYQRFVGPPDC